MQSPINTECRNFDNLNYYTCIKYLSKLGMIENNSPMDHSCFPHQADAYHHKSCPVEKHSQKSTSQSFSTVIRKPTVQYCLKSCFEKNDLTPNSKPNTHFENHFHHFKIYALLIIQKYSYSKKI